MNILRLQAILCALAIAAFSSTASASSVTLSGPGTVGLGDSFSISLDGDFDPTGLFAGGAIVLWDDSLLTLTNITMLTPLDTFIGCAGTFAGNASCAQTSSDVAFLFSNFFAGNYVDPGVGLSAWATMDFTATAVGGGLAGISIITDPGQGWAAPSGASLTPTLTGTSVQIGAIPVPAAVWLFGSGLVGLVGVARRRKAA